MVGSRLGTAEGADRSGGVVNKRALLAKHLGGLPRDGDPTESTMLFLAEVIEEAVAEAFPKHGIPHAVLDRKRQVERWRRTISVVVATTCASVVLTSNWSIYAPKIAFAGVFGLFVFMAVFMAFSRE